ncbi:glycosyltransferase family 2 protein [Pseudoflavonifractor sp. An184]|uniref:glycosyltransferase family 2 protein n=1 Tax=Pseudoflavonifractor sp. An184 TaxID=1965576 RepID=UPI000B36DE6F|nr:glycosyltransferase family 2 protein [Pseudoflavonifractor sp. An184]OUP51737.1 hypothetical protein B5F19_14215 [Pseudoflavonifractor sp. An184]
MIKISVIIPVYNAEKYLYQCLSSILTQTLKEIEILCINDGSTDNSAHILEEFHAKDARVKIITQKNSGSGAARNNGLTHAGGEYIAFMDGDDYYPSPSCLERLYTSAVEHSALICGGSLQTDIGTSIRRGKTQFPMHIFTEERFVLYSEVQYDYGYYRYIYRKDLLDHNNIRFPDYLRFQDPPFFVKAMVCAKKFYCIPDDVYTYRWGHQNVNWNKRRTNDLVRGLLDNLIISSKHQLVQLHIRCIERLNKDYYEIIENGLYASNIQLFELLIKFNCNINHELISSEYAEPYIIKPLKNFYLNSLNQKQTDSNLKYKQLYTDVVNSVSFRVGRAITLFPRKLRNGILCFQEHGFSYTWDRLLVHLHIKADPYKKG